MPYTNKPIFFQDLISKTGVDISRGSDARITLFRRNEKYVFSLISSLKSLEKKHRMFPEDKLYVEPLIFRPERVLIVGETGAQRSVLIDAFKRPSLSDTIFTGSVLNNITSDFSQVYVLRRQLNREFSAYHLDITNPARINIASDFEMRPDDIVFVAPQPLTIYSRALQQILGSYSITAQARDSLRSELQ